MTPPSLDPREQPAGESPFGAGPGPLAQRIRKLTVWAVLLVGAMVFVVVIARKGRPKPSEAGHVHGAAPAPAPAAMSVTLGERDQERIGVTFASVVQGPLERNLRIVGQVTVDETRLSTVSPRVDGWAERVHVDFTGRQVRKGEPLLDLYSPMLVTAEQEYLLARQLKQNVAQGTPEAVQGSKDVLAAARRRLVEWQVPETELRRLEETGQPSHSVTLEAPTGGVVVEKNVLPGQRIMAGDAALPDRRPGHGVARGGGVRAGPAGGPSRSAGDGGVPGAPGAGARGPDRLHLSDPQPRDPDRPGPSRPAQPGASAQARHVRHHPLHGGHQPAGPERTPVRGASPPASATWSSCAAPMVASRREM